MTSIDPDSVSQVQTTEAAADGYACTTRRKCNNATDGWVFLSIYIHIYMHKIYMDNNIV